MLIKRIEKVNELIKRELSQMLLKNIELPVGVIVTISQVRTSNDLSQAKVYLQILPINKSQDIFQLIEKAQKKFQALLSHKLITYRCPKIIFFNDKTGEKAERLNQLLDSL